MAELILDEQIRFSQEVIDKLNFYVYRLIDPRNGETFYVGKGVRNRVFAHINDEEDEYKRTLVDLEGDYDDIIISVSQKFKRIREIRSAGEEVIHVIHRHGLDSNEAFLVEATLIDAFPGLTNIQGGTDSSGFGPMSVKQIQNLYETQEAIFDENIMLIAINKRWKEDISSKELYDITRFAWKVSKERAEKAEFVVAHSKGIIREVYKAEEWLQANMNNFKKIIHMEKMGTEPSKYPTDRFAFNGSVADEISGKYKGLRVPGVYRKKGAANPIKYTFPG